MVYLILRHLKITPKKSIHIHQNPLQNAVVLFPNITLSEALQPYTFIHFSKFVMRSVVNKGVIKVFTDANEFENKRLTTLEYECNEQTVNSSCFLGRSFAFLCCLSVQYFEYT